MTRTVSVMLAEAVDRGMVFVEDPNRASAIDDLLDLVRCQLSATDMWSIFKLREEMRGLMDRIDG